MYSEDIIGHKELRNYFNSAVEGGVLSHAHLIIGEEGIGKSLIAKELAVRIIGKTEIKPYVDIMEFRVSKTKKSIGVEDIRGIIEEISKKPFEGDKKAIIVYQGHKMTAAAQNAFLKTIEEPPAGVFIIILSEDSEAILDTIKSRCQMHKLTSLSKDEMMGFIDKNYTEISDEEKISAMNFAEGVPGRCDHFIKDNDFKILRSTALELIIDINKLSDAEFEKYLDFLVKNKDMSEEIFSLLISFIRDIIIYKNVNNKENIINKDKFNYIEECSDSFSYRKLQKIIEALNEARSNLNSNVNPSLVFQVMLINMLQ
ncbi:DNA polymerase III subunit delta' [Clostridium sp. 19966]|uniref:DNA polymerase III subunit delta' n=1 Tax=Clostridium sp. 19966 TaxID=2768166 RepID=UPI0028DE9FA6|nr:DNA polymerase III subunit delta' [Clostridium sp. 19966]MDT8715779.1 DNA polymerase III subunit delta' [Clostridium sp. 19966]